MMVKGRFKARALALLLAMAMVLCVIFADGGRNQALAKEAGAYGAYLPTEEDDDEALAAKQVTFNGIKWYIIEDDSTAVDAGTVTLFAKEPIGESRFNDDMFDYDKYSTSKVKGYLDGLTAGDGSFAGVADAIVTIPSLTTKEYGGSGTYDTAENVRLYLLSREEAEALPVKIRKCSSAESADSNPWWLRSPGANYYNAAFVYGENGDVYDLGNPVNNEFGVRPALKLNLSAVTFDSESKTFSVKPYTSYVNTTNVIKFDGKDWYLIEDNSTAVNAGTVTLLAKECVGASEFGYYNTYSGSTVETFVNNWYTNDNNISADAKAAVSGNGMFLLTIAQAKAITNAEVRECSNASNGAWWLCSQGFNATLAAFVRGGNGYVNVDGYYVNLQLGVRPALKLNLSSVIFSSESMTFSLKEKAVVKTAPIAKKPSYDGSAQELVIAGQAIDGEMQYALGKDSTTAPEASAFTKSIPTATDAGTYYVWYKAKGDQLHWDSEPVPVTASIAQKTLTITAKDQTYSYNGEIQGPGDTVYTEVGQIKEKVDVKGLVGNDALTSIILDGQATDIGVYNNCIMPSSAAIGDHTANYDITYISGTLTIKSPYSWEWVKGKWYEKDGSQTYEPTGSWKKDGTDWMYVDDSGWRAENRWQKIDGLWYFFDREGHMTRDAYQKDASGKIWYLTKNGSWDEKEAVAGWTQDDKGWKFVLYGDDDLKNTWKRINGNWYYFKADGYAAQSEFVKGWWLNASCIQSDPVRCSWHKDKNGWWYGGGKWYAKNATYTIDGKAYTFDKEGYCVE